MKNITLTINATYDDEAFNVGDIRAVLNFKTEDIRRLVGQLEADLHKQIKANNPKEGDVVKFDPLLTLVEYIESGKFTGNELLFYLFTGYTAEYRRKTATVEEVKRGIELGYKGKELDMPMEMCLELTEMLEMKQILDSNLGDFVTKNHKPNAGDIIRDLRSGKLDIAGTNIGTHKE